MSKRPGAPLWKGTQIARVLCGHNTRSYPRRVKQSISIEIRRMDGIRTRNAEQGMCFGVLWRRSVSDWRVTRTEAESGLSAGGKKPTSPSRMATTAEACPRARAKKEQSCIFSKDCHGAYDTNGPPLPGIRSCWKPADILLFIRLGVCFA